MVAKRRIRIFAKVETGSLVTLLLYHFTKGGKIAVMHVVPKLRMLGATSPRVSVVWWLIKHWGNVSPFLPRYILQNSSPDITTCQVTDFWRLRHGVIAFYFLACNQTHRTEFNGLRSTKVFRYIIMFTSFLARSVWKKLALLRAESQELRMNVCVI